MFERSYRPRRARWAWLAGATAVLFTAAAVLAGRDRAIARADPSRRAEAFAANETFRSAGVRNPPVVITVSRPKSQVFSFLRDVQNWPCLMSGLQVEGTGAEGRWRLRLGVGHNATAEVRVSNDPCNFRIWWQPDARTRFEAKGSLALYDAEGGLGTDVVAQFLWRPSGGTIGQAFCNLWPPQRTEREVARMKALLEKQFTGHLRLVPPDPAPVRRTKTMPAKSKVQQKAAGTALAAKRGEAPKAALKGASKSMEKSMSEGELKELAETSQKGLPERKD